jgi:hypothetical protein
MSNDDHPRLTQAQEDALTVEILRRDALHVSPTSRLLVVASDDDHHVIAAAGLPWLDQRAPDAPWPDALAVSIENVLSGGPQPPPLYLKTGQLFTTERANRFDLTFEEFSACTGFTPPDEAAADLPTELGVA